MKVLGLDVSTHTGYCIIEKQEEGLKVSNIGLWKMDNKLTLTQKLQFFAAQLLDLLVVERPDVVVMEDVYYFKFPQTLMILSMFKAIVMLVVSQVIKKEVVFYQAASVRKVLGLPGNIGDKQKTYDKICALLEFDILQNVKIDKSDIKNKLYYDLSDAMALAYTYFVVGEVKSKKKSKKKSEKKSEKKKSSEEKIKSKRKIKSKKGIKNGEKTETRRTETSGKNGTAEQ